MAFAAALQNFLENENEPLKKRIKLAENTFISAEVPLEHKEAFLFKWVLKYSNHDAKNQEELFELLVKWAQDDQFKELSRNDIGNSDVDFIINVLLEKLKSEDLDSHIKDQILNASLSLLNNKIFRDYFKQNIEKYCNFLSLVIINSKSEQCLLGILKNPWSFDREVTVQDKFHKYFLEIVLPSLVQKWIKFGSEQIFLEISKVVQKSIFFYQSNNFEVYCSHFFEEASLDTTLDKKNSSVPKSVLKHLLSCYDLQDHRAYFKLLFHAFCSSFKTNSSLIYKFLILVIQSVGYDISSNFKLFKLTKSKLKISFEKSLDVYDVLLDVLECYNISFECKIQETAFIDFLRNMLKSLCNFGVPSAKVYQIIIKTIKINPLVIEPIVNKIFTFVTMANNENQTELYEKLVVATLEVFVKLHRIQNLVSRIIPEMKKAFEGRKETEVAYQFLGKIENQEVVLEKIIISNFFTENILKYFTKCVCDLASWQVINLFKTMLFHLKEAVNEFSASGDTPDKNKLSYLEILGVLTSRLIQSCKMADFTVTTNTIEKFVKGLDDLKSILENFGTAILKREHNPVTMRTFLSLCFNWAEIYMTLTYYSLNGEVKIPRIIDNTYSACNLMYLHSYLDVKQWQLICQRITNFGEYTCKRLLQKLCIQKIKAFTLFENDFNKDISTNVVKQIQDHMDETWKDFLMDKFAVNNLFPAMDESSKLFLAENLIKDEDLLFKQPYILDSGHFINILIYVTISKINKHLAKPNKKKKQENVTEFLSVQLFSNLPEGLQLKEDLKAQKICEKITQKLWQKEWTLDQIGNQEKVVLHLEALKNIPIIYTNVEVLKLVFMYIFCLHNDVSSVDSLKKICEDLIIGILQSSKVSVSEILDLKTLCPKILQNFERHDQMFSLVINNALRDEENLEKMEFCVDCLMNNSEDPKFLRSCVTIFKALNKLSKSKTNSDLKTQLKEKIVHKLVKNITKTEFCLEAYAVCLKHHLSLNENTDNCKKLLKKLPVFTRLALSMTDNVTGSLLLFLTVLHNKQKIVDVEEGLVLKVWKWLKNIGTQYSDLEEYSQLVRLVVTLIANEEFEVVVDDLLKLTLENVQSKNTLLFTKQLKIWESVLTCNINPVKMTVWQKTVESLVSSLLELLKTSQADKELFSSMVHFEECVIQTHHFILSSNLIDSLLITPMFVMNQNDISFEERYSFCIILLEKLLSHRNALMMDRLPPFLQQYRILLRALCDESNSELNLEHSAINKMADLAHRLEKLTRNLIACKKDMGRIALYLVADILERYEHINLYSNVKLHLNNCIYSLLSLCDHHAVSYLMRVLSSASTEMFKIMYEHYKKYYMFTGKV